MKAAPEAQRRLLDLQEIDTTLVRLRRRSEQLPQHEQLVETERRIQETREAMMEVQHASEETQLEISRLESDVELVQQRLRKDASQLDVSTSGKEAAALTHELDALRERARVLEDMELVVMERLEEQQRSLADLTSSYEQLKSERAELIAQRDAELSGIEQQREELTSARLSLVGDLPSDLVDVYEQRRERYGIGAAMLRGKISEGSNMALADAELVEIRETPPDELVFCQVSGCILVRTEESAL